MHFSADTAFITIYTKYAFDFAETAPSKDVIWDEFSDQHQTRAPKKHDIQCPLCPFLMLIRFKFNAHFGWESL